MGRPRKNCRMSLRLARPSIDPDNAPDTVICEECGQAVAVAVVDEVRRISVHRALTDRERIAWLRHVIETERVQEWADTY